MNDKEKFMSLALEEAKLGKGQVSPNPLVGCVIVKENKIISKGAHLKYGGLHAERNAINVSSTNLQGADIYVTLEPCNHYGQTPPCTEAIIESGIKKVYIGSIDPNPLVSGSGIKRLQEYGLQVEVGILQQECDLLNEYFFHSITTKLPFVLYKGAISLDGCISTNSGDSKWITSQTSRTTVHRLRSEIDAVMIGFNTALKDDPALTVRMCEGRNPVRIVVDDKLNLPDHLQIFTDGYQDKTFIITDKLNQNSRQCQKLRDNGVKFIFTSKLKDTSVFDLTSALYQLNEKKITSIMLEGGAGLVSAMFKQKLINKILLFQAPLLIGSQKHFCRFDDIHSVEEALDLNVVNIEKIDCDFAITAYPNYK